MNRPNVFDFSHLKVVDSATGGLKKNVDGGLVNFQNKNYLIFKIFKPNLIFYFTLRNEVNCMSTLIIYCEKFIIFILIDFAVENISERFARVVADYSSFQAKVKQRLSKLEVDEAKS